MDELADRFTADRYADDQPIVFRVFLASREQEGPVEVPERIFVRMQSIAAAYELRLLPVIDVYATTRLNALQCQGLEQEIAFIAEIVRDDRMLAKYLPPMMRLVQTCARSTRDAVLEIEGAVIRAFTRSPDCISQSPCDA